MWPNVFAGGFVFHLLRRAPAGRFAFAITPVTGQSEIIFLGFFHRRGTTLQRFSGLGLIRSQQILSLEILDNAQRILGQELVFALHATMKKQATADQIDAPRNATTEFVDQTQYSTAEFRIAAPADPPEPMLNVGHGLVETQRLEV
jgi:hypothetical protein